MPDQPTPATTTATARMAEYFNVLAPHSAAKRNARSPEWARANEQKIKVRLSSDGPDTWYARIEVIKDSGIFTERNIIDATSETFYRGFGIDPKTLIGKRVLDVGAFSGGMSFYAEDNGAEVVAIDIQRPETNGFSLVHDIRQSTVTHVTAAIYDLHPDLFGEFDYIVFSGVHYHLKHPMLALERLNSVTAMGGELLALGTSANFWLHRPGADMTAGVDFSRVTRQSCPQGMHIDELNDIPLLGFYKDCYMGDDSNWFIPNTAALADMITASGFAVSSTGTYPIHKPAIGRPIACSLVKATKVADPQPEYAPGVYAHLRRFDAAGTPSSTFKIPTWYELDAARRRADDAGT